MAFTLTVDDLAEFDFVETVSLYAISPAGGTPTIHTGITALKRAVTTPTTGGSVEMGIDHVRWHLQASTLTAGVVPLRAWKIKQADGTYWLIQSTATLSYGTRYVCECVKMEDT